MLLCGGAEIVPHEGPRKGNMHSTERNRDEVPTGEALQNEFGPSSRAIPSLSGISATGNREERFNGQHVSGIRRRTKSHGIAYIASASTATFTTLYGTPAARRGFRFVREAGMCDAGSASVRSVASRLACPEREKNAPPDGRPGVVSRCSPWRCAIRPFRAGYP